ncbi:MAG: hypothetical protein ACKO1F_01720 [Flammeovirgaceae bacterium]
MKILAELSRSNYVYQIPGPLTDSMFLANPRMSTRSRNYFNPDIYIPSLTLDWKLCDRTRMTWINSDVLGARNSVQLDKPATVVDKIDPTTRIFDVNASWKISTQLVVRVNVNNLTDLQYFTKRPTFYPGPGVWSSDGRSMNISVGFKI